jgi:Kef-type K+ transport system membrane component KefB
MSDLTETQLRAEELRLEAQRLALEHKRLYVEFAKFGFAGTLTAAIAGLITILGLAALNTFTQTKIETWGIVVIATLICVATVAFGYFSLWELPKIVTKVSQTGTDLTVGPGSERVRR